MVKWESESEAMNIRVEITPGPGYEADVRGFDLYRRAIVEMIENFDSGLLEKEEGYDESEHFYGSVLSALARHYMVGHPFPRDLTVQETLEELIKILVENGKLQEKVGDFGDDED